MLEKFITDILNSPEIRTVLLLSFLFILPRIFARFGIPMALTAFFLGIVAQSTTKLIFHDQIVRLLSVLGITSLFLFAGLEVDLHELRLKQKPLFQHVLLVFVIFILFTLGMIFVSNLHWITASIISLALLTPSTGFILDSLGTLGLPEDNREWVKIKAIASELVALFLLVVLAQFDRPLYLLLTVITVGISLFFLPWIFRKVSAPLSQLAPGSDFTLLIVLAIIISLITKKLGAYYLVGAFVVGIAARRFARSNRDTSTDELLRAIKLFASFFMPFYFLKAGAGVSFDYFTFRSFSIAMTFMLFAIPIRLFSVAIHRQISLKESFKEGFHVSISLLPTLVFGLVLANLLRESGRITPDYYGALIISTVVVTMVPSLFFKYGHLNSKLGRLSSLDY